jgi:hypothetical protein
MHMRPLRNILEKHTHETRLTYLNLSQANYQQRTLRRFRPSPEVYSAVANAILLNGENGLPSPKLDAWGQLSHRKDTILVL